MNRKMIMFTAAAILAAGATQALAQAPTIGVNQNVGPGTTVGSTLYANLSKVTGAIEATSAAIGNSATVDGNLATAINTSQVFNGNAVSNLGANLNTVVGDATLTSAAIGNSLSLDVNGATRVGVTQYANYDPTATLSVNAYALTGDLSETAAAIANSASISGAIPTLNTNQVSYSPAYASLSTNVNTVVGKVSATSAAIGNSLSVKGF